MSVVGFCYFRISFNTWNWCVETLLCIFVGGAMKKLCYCFIRIMLHSFGYDASVQRKFSPLCFVKMPSERLLEKLLLLVPCTIITNLFLYLGHPFEPFTGFDWGEFDTFNYGMSDKTVVWVN